MIDRESRMKILVIGSGGREHTLVWKIKQSPLASQIFCAPGNAGIATLAPCVDIKADDIQGLLAFAKGQAVDLTVVGPEAPLVAGIVDEFQKAGLKIFGPTRAAAQLEGSKAFAKEFMRRYRIPTADFQIFSDVNKAHHVLRVLRKEDYPVVVKADGLAAGKGVMICHNEPETETALVDILDKKIFKEAGNKIIVEECLKGEEVSILALCDGKSFVMLEPSQDHKRAFDNDEGPNTGGMGAYSPVPAVSPELIERISQEILEPTLRGMAKDGIPFQGVLYAGLMLTKEGPKVLEFNVRFGDPETEVILPRLKDDLIDLMLACCEGQIASRELHWERGSALCVVLASGGYPGDYETGKEIRGLNDILDPQTLIFHAGTKNLNSHLLTSGGRVLVVTGLGNTLPEASQHAYARVNRIHFEKSFFRKDIGAKAMKIVTRPI